MSLFDTYEILATDVDFDAGASGGDAYIGADLSVISTGDGAGLRVGVVYEAELIIQGAITGTTPTLASRILGKDSDGSYFILGSFPTIGAAGTPYPLLSMESAAGSIRCYFKCPKYTNEGKEVVAVRAQGTTTGSSTPTFNDVNITTRPALSTGSNS